MSTSTTDSPPPPGTGLQVRRDLVAGLTIFAIVAVFLGNAGEVGRGNYDWLFPVVLSYALAVLAAILVLRGLLGRGERMSLVPIVVRGQGLDVAFFSTLAVVYVVLVQWLGFWVMSVLMIAIGAIYLDTRRSTRGALVAIAVAITVCVVGYSALTEIFYIRFPGGPWGW